MFIIVNLGMFLALLFLLKSTSDYIKTSSLRVAVGLVAGVVMGSFLQLIYGFNNASLKETIHWINIFGEGYIYLLQMIVMPLIITSILAAVNKISSPDHLGKIGGTIIFLLLFMVAIAAIIALAIVNIFNLNGRGLMEAAQFGQTMPSSLVSKASSVEHFHAADFILSLIPQNPFLELTGAHANSIAKVIVFTIFLGMAALAVKKQDPLKGHYIELAIDLMQEWIMKLTRIILNLAPYGICALMTRLAASAQIGDISKMADFLLLSYLAMALMFIIHGFLLWLFGINPFRFFEKASSVLLFAFTSRSSMAAISMNIDTQVNRLKVEPPIASLAASFGASMGQNGCGGIYPAMLAAMTAASQGIDIMSWHWFFMLIFVVVIGSIGVAGIGGGALFAALIVLPNLGLPLTLVAIFMAIDPILDMGRTALNVSGSLVAGSLTNKLFGHKITANVTTNDGQ